MTTAAAGAVTRTGAFPPATVPFVDLALQHEQLGPDLLRALAAEIARNDLILGESVARFEEEFAAYVGTRYAVGVASGLDALQLSLYALGIGPGDEVLTVANTFFATALAIHRVGARPVFVDCDAETLSMDVDKAAAAVTPRTRAILPVHLYGRMADMPQLCELADRHGLIVIEDAAQAHGAALDGKSAGAFGAAGCFSFYPSKNLGALGDAGAVAVDDAALADRLKTLRNYGSKVKYEHAEAGFNSRLDSLQAVVLRLKLSHLDEWNLARRRAATFYRDRLQGLPIDLRCAPRDADFPADHVHHLFPIEVDDRDAVRARLWELGVQTGVHYPIPPHLSPALAHLGYKPGDFPIAERSAQRELSLPIFPEIREDQLQRVVDALEQTLIS